MVGSVSIGVAAWFLVRFVLTGFFTVDPNERAVKTILGRAQRLGTATTLDTPLADLMRPDERERYVYPLVRVIGPGGPYFKWPWEHVHKISVATETINMAKDFEDPTANSNGTILQAVTKDQLDTGLEGQIRYRVSDANLYAYLFGVKKPIAHVIGYFVSILRERIANYEATQPPETDQSLIEKANESLAKAGVSINDLRKNLNHLNIQMDQQCISSAARYGMILDASLITGIDPPADIESALAAINTVHNEVSSNISLAQANADQRIEQSRRAVEIETNRAEAEVQPLRWMAQQLSELKQSGEQALPAYIRNIRLDLFSKASRVILRAKG